MAGTGAVRTIYSGSAVAPVSAWRAPTTYTSPTVRRTVSINGGSSGGGFVGPRRIAIPAPRTVTSSRPVTITPRSEYVSHYDPSRVIDLDRMRIVKDMRSMPEFAEKRGDTQDGDNGVMSPSESRTGTIAAPGGTRAGAGGAAGAALQKNLVPIALAIGAFILFGG